MNARNSKNISSDLPEDSLPASETDWQRLVEMADDEIDYSDLPEQGEAFFRNAQLRMPSPKQTVTIRLDTDVVDWFKAQGKGYQTRINAVLRLYMDAQNRSTRTHGD